MDLTETVSAGQTDTAPAPLVGGRFPGKAFGGTIGAVEPRAEATDRSQDLPGGS
ncbi:hypothetical protein [Streptomyces sp. NPDC003863]